MLYALISVFVFLTSLAWEHMARLRKWVHKPSVALNMLAQFCEDVWFFCGKCLVLLSSFYNFIYEHLADLWPTLKELFDPCIRIISSVQFFVHGYVETALTYVNRNLIVLGTATLCMVTGWYLYTLYKKNEIAVQKWWVNTRCYKWLKTLETDREQSDDEDDREERWENLKTKHGIGSRKGPFMPEVKSPRSRKGREEKRKDQEKDVCHNKHDEL